MSQSDSIDRKIDHEWHVAINQHHDRLRKEGRDWEPWMYEARSARLEVPRLMKLFRMERTGTLPTEHQQCSYSAAESIQDNHLTCCFGIRCAECPALQALNRIEGATPGQIDEAKAWTCAAHILREGENVDTSEGYVCDVGDRMYWDRVHQSLAQSGIPG